MIYCIHIFIAEKCLRPLKYILKPFVKAIHRSCGLEWKKVVQNILHIKQITDSQVLHGMKMIE